MDAAHDEFARSGFHGASTARIAAAAGCSEPMLYKHFASKQELFIAVLVESSRIMEDRFDMVLEAPGDMFENFRGGLGVLFADPTYPRTIRMRMLALGAVDVPEIRAALDGINERLRDRISRAIARGKAEGSCRDEIDATYVYWLWVGISYAGSQRESLDSEGFAGMLPYLLKFIESLTDQAIGEQS